jgi:hypothetical protein
MKKEFVMRGQTASGETEILNFSGYKPGYAYRLTELLLYPSVDLHGQNAEHTASITAGKTAVAPIEPNFNDEGLIATAYLNHANGPDDPNGINYSVVNDTFLITQNLILMVQDSHSTATNWQCRFKAVKMSGPEEAATNYKQFTISDE